MGWSTVFDAQSPNQDIPRHQVEYLLRLLLTEFIFVVLLDSIVILRCVQTVSFSNVLCKVVGGKVVLVVELVVVASEISPNCILIEIFRSEAVFDLQSPNQDIPRHHFEYFGSLGTSSPRLIPFTGCIPRLIGDVVVKSVVIIELVEKGTSVNPQKSPLVNSVSM